MRYATGLSVERVTRRGTTAHLREGASLGTEGAVQCVACSRCFRSKGGLTVHTHAVQVPNTVRVPFLSCIPFLGACDRLLAAVTQDRTGVRVCVCWVTYLLQWAVPSDSPLDVLQLTAPPLGSCRARPSLSPDTSGMSVTLSC